MLSCDYLRKVLTREAERLGEGEVDALISEADPEGTGFRNFKQVRLSEE
jgi:Ca2+-binding EF-hand superfamily protein